MLAIRLFKQLLLFTLFFTAICIASFINTKPILTQTEYDARAEWDSYVRAVKERNDILPAMAETLKSFQPAYAKITAGILESRAVAVRASDPNVLVPAINEIDRLLLQVEKLTKSNPQMESHTAFINQWRSIARLSIRIQHSKKSYNNIANLYNRLLTAFPQNVVIKALAYVPLTIYPETPGPGSEEIR